MEKRRSVANPADAMRRLEAAVEALEAALQRFVERRLQAAAGGDAHTALAELRASFEAEIQHLQTENRRLREVLARVGTALEESAGRLEKLAEE